VRGTALERVIGDWIAFYNGKQPHTAIAGRTPAEAYAHGSSENMMDRLLCDLPTSPLPQQRQKENRSEGLLGV